MDKTIKLCLKNYLKLAQAPSMLSKDLKIFENSIVSNTLKTSGDMFASTRAPLFSRIFLRSLKNTPHPELFIYSVSLRSIINLYFSRETSSLSFCYIISTVVASIYPLRETTVKSLSSTGQVTSINNPLIL